MRWRRGLASRASGRRAASLAGLLAAATIGAGPAGAAPATSAAPAAGAAPPVTARASATPAAPAPPTAPTPGQASPATAPALPAPPEGPRATDADRAALAEILARPEFRPVPGTGRLRALLLGWWGWLLEQLGTAEAERYAVAGRTLFFAAAGAALLAALLRRRTRRRGAPAAAGSGPAVASAPAPGDVDVDAAAAEAALARGDLAGAVRAALVATSDALERDGAVAGAGALTGPELAARVGEPALAELARLHDRTVFGRLAPTAAEARGAVALARRMAAREASP